MKYNEILTDFRNRIVAGEFSPGAQIPLRAELLAHYDASLGTLQKAVNVLQQEGFLDNCGPHGTRVSQNPPHLFNIAVIVPVEVGGDGLWDSFFESFSEAARQYKAGGGEYRFDFYYSVERHATGSDECRRLYDNLDTHRIGGAILLQHTTLSESMIRRIQTVPTVAFSDHPLEFGRVVPLEFNYPGLLRLAGSILREEGCHTPAVLVHTGKLIDFVPQCIEILREGGLEIIPARIQGVDLTPEGLPWCVPLVELLFMTKTPPDSLIVMNENFLPLVTATLHRLKLDHIRVVSHANYPAPPRETGAVKLVFDSRYSLKRALEAILECRHAGERPNLPPTLIHALPYSQMKKKFNWKSSL